MSETRMVKVTLTEKEWKDLDRLMSNPLLDYLPKSMEGTMTGMLITAGIKLMNECHSKGVDADDLGKYLAGKKGK